MHQSEWCILQKQNSFRWQCLCTMQPDSLSHSCASCDQCCLPQCRPIVATILHSPWPDLTHCNASQCCRCFLYLNFVPNCSSQCNTAKRAMPKNFRTRFIRLTDSDSPILGAVCCILSTHLSPLTNSHLSHTGMCNKCGEKVVGEGSGCTAMEMVYHIQCFTCFDCRKCDQWELYIHVFMMITTWQTRNFAESHSMPWTATHSVRSATWLVTLL